MQRRAAVRGERLPGCLPFSPKIAALFGHNTPTFGYTANNTAGRQTENSNSKGRHIRSTARTARRRRRGRRRGEKKRR
ncbi:hypothetical protein DFP72DRAFT_1174766, partial [Ephemerocybe angulata]